MLYAHDISILITEKRVTFELPVEEQMQQGLVSISLWNSTAGAIF